MLPAVALDFGVLNMIHPRFSASSVLRTFEDKQEEVQYRQEQHCCEEREDPLQKQNRAHHNNPLLTAVVVQIDDHEDDCEDNREHEVQASDVGVER